MTTLLHIALVLLAAPAVLACSYLLALTALSRRAVPPRASARQIRFDIVVPAHDEAQVIERTLASLAALDWPADRRRIHVIADNCMDPTADIARRCGARVHERRDEQERGKGYALRYAFNISKREGWAQAIVVVDADSKVSPNLLEAIAVRLEGGEHAVQVHYGVLNPLDSWRTRLMTIAMECFHTVRSRARERLRVSCGIRGNGWCVTHELLTRVPYGAFSLTEDLEYGIELGRSGYRVAYADEAHVLGEMVSGARAAGRQRQRWEQGRSRLVRAKIGPVLRCALGRRSRVCADLALDLLVPPLSAVVLLVIAFLGAALGAFLPHPADLPWVWAALACWVALILYVARGWQLSGVGARGCLDLLRVPVFLAWKLSVSIGSRAAVAWIRTERE
ncbi:MAG TPA: glycosyltransferase family 2 protein [Steroidobacteraceae bacterium]|nr:glycosyltransferase family 2 protein [Steroidobacteraceae bacterium]